MNLGTKRVLIEGSILKAGSVHTDRRIMGVYFPTSDQAETVLWLAPSLTVGWSVPDRGRWKRRADTQCIPHEVRRADA